MKIIDKNLLTIYCFLIWPVEKPSKNPQLKKLVKIANQKDLVKVNISKLTYLKWQFGQIG